VEAGADAAAEFGRSDREFRLVICDVLLMFLVIMLLLFFAVLLAVLLGVDSAEIINIVTVAGSKNPVLYGFLRPWLAKLITAVEHKHMWRNAGQPSALQSVLVCVSVSVCQCVSVCTALWALHL
jgi:hypothetical protein